MSYLLPATLDPAFPPSTEQQESNPLVQTLLVLSSQIQAKTQIALNDLCTLINSHPFFVLFEARLACNAQTDHTVARSVLPVFQDDFNELFASLQAEILRDLEPYLTQLTQETAICWKGENSGILKKFKEIQLENATSRTKIVQLEAEKKDNALNYQMQLKKLQNEILYLREMLFQQKRIGMPIYKPDYEGEYGQQKDKMEIFTKKQHDDILAEIMLKNQKQLDKLEKDYKAQIYQILKQLADERAAAQQLRAQMQEVEMQLQESRQQSEIEAQRTSQEYEGLFIQLYQAIQEANGRTKLEADKYEGLIAQKDARIAELEALIRQLRLENDKLNTYLASARSATSSAANSARGAQDQPAKLLAELTQLRELNRRLQESLDETLRGKQYIEEAFAALKDQLDYTKLDDEQRQKIAAAELAVKRGKAADQQNSFSAEMEELRQLLQSSRDAYDGLKKASNALFQSLFYVDNGGLAHLMQLKDPRFSPYEQLKADVKKWNLNLDSLRDLSRSLYLVKEWCRKFCPEAAVYDDKQFIDLLQLNQKLNDSFENGIGTAGGISARRQGGAGAASIYQAPVNSVILHPSLLSDKRIENGTLCDVGVNTSICTSLEDGAHGAVMVDKSVMFECSSCSTSRANSRQSSRAGSAFQRESLAHDSTGGRPGSAAQLHQANQPDQAANHAYGYISEKYGYQGDMPQRSGATSQMKCPECGKYGQITRIDISAGDGRNSAVNITQHCNDCRYRSAGAQIICPACSKAGTAENAEVFAEDSDDSVEYFEENDFVRHKHGDLDVKELGTKNVDAKDLDAAACKRRPQSGVVRNNSDAKLQRPQTADVAKSGPKQRGLQYTCPYCYAKSKLGEISLTTGFPQFIYEDQFVQPSRLRGHSAPIYAQQAQNALYQPARFSTTAYGRHTEFETDGTVFDRLLRRAKELEERFNRKRDLILQERKRTTERALRSLSLFIEHFPPTESLYSTKGIRNSANLTPGLKASQTVRFQTSQVSMRFSSPVKAFLRPQSSKVDEVTQSGKKMFRNRPMSSGGAPQRQGRQESVLELLAASGVLKK